MIPTPPALAYRRAATQQASVVGLVISLYDTLAGDMRRAALALRLGQIEERSKQIKHGFSVLTQLDSLIDSERGGETATNLRRFYAYLRHEMLQAQFNRDPSLLDQASGRLIDVREAWQKVDTRAHSDSFSANSKQDPDVYPTTLDCQA